ncbi:MAG: alanine--glyoxylate aminotransferase, partial [Acidobacteria bacterium]
MTLPVIVQHAPRFTVEQVRRLAAELFEVDGAAEALPSERDQNFRLALPSGQAFVLKIANAMERREVLDLQNAAMEHLEAQAPGLATPRVVPARDGRAIAEATGEDGRRHFVRLVTWVPGRVLAAVRPHTEALLESLGRAAGEMDRAFASFEHPAMHRDFPWDLAGTLRMRAELEHVDGAERRALLGGVLDRFEREVQPRLPRLPRQVVHNDWNDHNVIASPGSEGAPVVLGVVDFGDMLHSIAVADLAVCCAYSMLGKPDPVGAAAAVVRGYHERRPLEEAELGVLFELIRARLVISAVMAACQLEQAPGNEYLRISQGQVWSLLERLERVSPAFAHYRFRAACGLPPCPQSAAVVAWLREHSHEFAAVTTADLRTGPVTVLDLSVGSPEIDSLATVQDPGKFTELAFGRIAAEGTEVGIGRYDEPRLVYVSELFRHDHNWVVENRTLHVGIDVFQPVGTPVFAPMAGRVHSVANNQAAGDYGPTIVLEHQTDEGVPFWTLYGHLDLPSLALEPGRIVERGERIGRMGDVTVNGGWPPHVHFQVMVDSFGRAGDFPGVAPPSERAVWLSLVPDPNVILGIPENVFP